MTVERTCLVRKRRPVWLHDVDNNAIGRDYLLQFGTAAK